MRPKSLISLISEVFHFILIIYEPFYTLEKCVPQLEQIVCTHFSFMHIEKCMLLGSSLFYINFI